MSRSEKPTSVGRSGGQKKIGSTVAETAGKRSIASLGDQLDVAVFANETLPSLTERTADSYERLQKLLAQKIDSTHERVEGTKKLVEAFRDREAQFDEILVLRREIAAGQAQLESRASELTKVADEAKKVRVEARSVEIKLRQLDAENAALRAQLAKSQNVGDQVTEQIDRLNAELDSSRSYIARLQREKADVEAIAENLRRGLVNMHEVATAEIGRVVKALLHSQNKLRWTKPPTLQKQAALLVGAGIVDPQGYLDCHKDVADAGMDPVEHYILHGAGEGRDPTGVLRNLLGGS